MAHAVTPLFSTLAQDSDLDVDMAKEGMREIDSDVEMIGKEKGKIKKKEKVLVKNQKSKVLQVEPPKPQVEEQSEDEEMEDIAQPQPIINKPPKKPAAKPIKVVTEDQDQDMDIQSCVIVSRLPAPKAKTRPIPIATGELHEPPCEQCQKSNRSCQKEQSGRACVSCKFNKHKCGYLMLNLGRQVESRAMVEESEWEDATESGAATTSWVACPAARQAKQAIQEDAAAATKPPHRSRKKSTPPVLNAAVALNAMAGEYAVLLFSTSAH